MHPNTFEIAYNKEHLEYYAYLRDTLEAPHISYWIGNPSVQITNGLICFASLPENNRFNLDDQDQYLHHYKNIIIQNAISSSLPFSRSLLLMGIPTSKSPVEVFDRFRGFSKWVEEARVVKTSHFRYYAMMLLLDSSENSFSFLTEFLCEEYNSLEIQKILIREIKGISIHSTGLQEGEQSRFNFIRSSNEQEVEVVSPLKIFLKCPEGQIRKNSLTPTKKDSFSFSNMYQQFGISPGKKIEEGSFGSSETCAICFQENDETLISTLCEHYFHISCLSRWKEETCPLCRYHQQPPIIQFCEKCNHCEGLWVCLVCGVRMCCGSKHDILAEDSHIYEHYLETQHRLSMDIETKFIFDASQASFLHKMFYQQMMKSKEGIEGLDVQDMGLGVKKKEKKNKISETISEFEQNISEEMQIQRVYFSENINQEVKWRKERMKEKQKRIIEMETQISAIESESVDYDKERLLLEEKNENLERQMKIILNVQGFWKQKSVNAQKMMREQDQKQESQLFQLNLMIEERKEELKDYKTNISMQNKLKSNLGSDKVKAQAYLGPDLSKKKK